ncbi:MAG: aldo/keto reductase [Pirellulales bacterium]
MLLPAPSERKPYMVLRQLGHTGIQVTPLGFGAFKIGRNQKTHYGYNYNLPSDKETEQLLNGILDLGINVIDTAPAYGLSEKQIGRFLSTRRGEYILSTKVGEHFKEGVSSYDFSSEAIRKSLQRSLRQLQTDYLDIAFIHSSGADLEILNETAAVETLQALKTEGLVRAIGFSGRDPVAELQSLSWADVLMVEYHCENTEHSDVIGEAGKREVGVMVKKGLASGRLEPARAIPYVLKNPDVCTLAVGGLNLEHFRENMILAGSA